MPRCIHAFRAEEQAIDGIFVGDDYLAQGVLYGLELEEVPHDRMQFVAIVNKKVKLRSPWPVTVFEIDGQLVGRAMADLVHTHLVDPAQAPGDVTLAAQVITPRMHRGR